MRRAASDITVLEIRAGSRAYCTLMVSTELP